jgi:hypothetical protein
LKEALGAKKKKFSIPMERIFPLTGNYSTKTVLGLGVGEN